MEPIVEKKRRGRKAKIQTTEPQEESAEKIPKKRGRKPKGGKVVLYQPSEESLTDQKVNIVLHLKCNSEDLESSINNEAPKVEHFKFSEAKTNDLNYMVYNTKIETTEEEEENSSIPSDNMKTIWKKLEKLSNNLHIDNICDKKSACFHCTYDFDNIPIYIPKYELNKTYYVYGCFCSPECACAYLMNEKSIDTTTRFERYQLLNFLYCKIYDYSKINYGSNMVRLMNQIVVH